MHATPPLQPTLWRTCRVLANRRRLRILQLLMKERELTVSAVARQLELSVPVASQYLRALEARSLLEARRQGGRVLYRFREPDEAGPLPGVLRALRAGFRSGPAFAHQAFRDATAFTHPRRIVLYRALEAWNDTSERLRAATKTSRFALARHLAKLASRGLIRREEGRWATCTPPGALAAALVRLAVE